MDSIGARIKQVRLSRGLTQAQLGARCHMADSAIRRYESGRGNPTFETLQRIADALEITVEYLVGGPEKELCDRFDHYGAVLDIKLRSIGYSVGSYEEDACLWINYPDGILLVSDVELKELDADTDAYLRFKLLELKERHPERFKPD
ncbi:MAG TPA: helix-turn-helix domain-containing protein [Candidatus Flavonifractor intestinipullorum]|uniref:Helix-turn-helix domain-containing protein n=1 Tax=Candidatus Flavonifractor intestinipullorum TaxID=2838587 RepID=A0A9D2MCL0_9FIRM|nr:helix-turn-helix domain-containing protein [Candidatus Flavonifractor intestinipullorum]